LNILPRINFCGVLTVLCSEIRHCAKRQNVNGKNLSYKKSDLKPFNYKYQLSTDITKIPIKGWTQIELNTSRILAQTWEGQEIKDSYTIQGIMFIEIATDKGNFTKKIPISVYVDTLPF
jgi:hypothetical protein